ncbi:MAG: hypothetical protein CUN56_15505, partial [Phototrophicales bacterium]
IGSAGWVALMLWDFYRYGLDKQYLEKVIYPMLRGSLRVYQAIMAHSSDGFTFWSPSPEYIESGKPAWFEMPSFHLAIIHGLVQACKQSVLDLGKVEPELAAWDDMAKRLPKACIQDSIIGVGKGVALGASHRHHSHLAGIYPFDTFDIEGKDKQLIHHNMYHWAKLGYGDWVGWSMPWAAIIWSRQHEAEAAFHFLDIYERFFT